MLSLVDGQHTSVEQLLQNLQRSENAHMLAALGVTNESISLALEAISKTEKLQTVDKLFNQVTIGIVILDHGLRITTTNDFAYNIFSQFSPWIENSSFDQVLKTKSFQSMLSSGVQRFLVWIQAGCEGPLEVELINGVYLLHGVCSGQGLRSTYCISMTPHKIFSTQLKRVELFQQAFNAIDYPMMLLNSRGLILFASPSLSMMTGIAQEELVGQRADSVFLPSHAELFSKLEQLTDDYNSWKGVVNVKTSDLILLEVQVSVSGFTKNKNKSIEHYVVSINDMSDTMSEQDRLEQLANTDGLTGISNRLHFGHIFRKRLKNAQREGSHLTLFFIDLDKFKLLNDNHGHRYGDMLLVAITQRIQRNIRDNDFVARIGGDEFAVLMNSDLPQTAVESFANKMLTHLHEPYHLDDIRYKLTMSIGAACYPNDGLTQEELLHNADIAMYFAKASENQKCEFYNKHLQLNLLLKNEFEEDLEKALHLNGFELFFQPQHNLRTGDIVGFEALFRLKNSELKSVNIDRFIAEAERTGLIVPLGKKILKLAFHHIQAWFKRGLTIPIAINLSAIQLRDTSTLTYIKNLVANFPECAPLVHFEITETSLFERSLDIDTVITELSNLGLTIALDDFGTGHSSIYSLKKFPFKIIKTDATFVNGITHGDEDDRLILITMIKMINGLHLELIAEGIETQEQLEFLIEHGCIVGQGFLFSKPLPSSEVMRYINKQSFQSSPVG